MGMLDIKTHRDLLFRSLVSRRSCSMHDAMYAGRHYKESGLLVEQTGRISRQPLIRTEKLGQRFDCEHQALHS